MSDEQGRAARASYNKMSGIYGLLSDDSEKQFVEAAIRQELKPKPGEIILEPGFGTGQVLVALAEMVGDAGKVFGIDISDGMVEETKKRVLKKSLENRVEIVRGDAAKMPYPDRFFDAVFMSFALELFPDEEIPIILAECMRVLKTNGRICVACMSDQGKSGAMMKMYVWAHKKFPNFVDCRPIFAKKALESAGFDIVTQKILSMWGLPVEIVLGRTGRAYGAD